MMSWAAYVVIGGCTSTCGDRELPTQAKKQENWSKIYISARRYPPSLLWLVNGSVRFGPAGVHITGDRYRSMADETVLDG